VAQIPFSPLFPVVGSGAASPDFSLLSLIEDDGCGKLRIRVFKTGDLLAGDLEPYRVFIVKNVHSSTATTNGGTFSADNKYLSVTYLLAGRQEENIGVLVIINVKTGDVVQAKIGLTFWTSPVFFTVNGRQYVTVGWTRADIHDPSVSDGEFFLDIYQLDECNNNKRLKLVFRTITPALTTALDVFDKPNSALIAIGFHLDPPVTEARIFKFDGKRIELVVRERTANSIDAVRFDFTGNFLAVSQHPVTDSTHTIPNRLTLLRLPTKEDPQVRQVAFSQRIPALTYTLSFNEDGSRLLASGARTPELGDLILFRIEPPLSQPPLIGNAKPKKQK
jgi:hypothetical protein